MNVGTMASAVHLAACTDVRQEPFTNLAAWTVTGTVTLPAGRTGTAAQISGGSGNRATYTIPALNESDMVTVGFAWRRTDANTTARDIVDLYSDAAVTEHNRLLYAPSTTTLSFTRGSSSTLVQNAAITFTQNTWYYIEVQSKLHDTVGSVTVRVNGVQVLNGTNLDTRNAGTKTTYDTVRLTTAATSNTGQWDDLYISTGAGCTFQGDHTIP
jgi:hypothetical protein